MKNKKKKIKIGKILPYFRRSLNRIFAQIRKELDWAIHDKLSMAILFLMPIFLFILMGNGTLTIIEQTGPAIIYIIDQDDTEISAAYISNFRDNNFGADLEIHDNINEPNNVTIKKCKDLISTKELDAYLIIPANFSDELFQNMSSKVYLTVDSLTPAKLSIKKAFTYGNLVYQIDYQIFNGEIIYFPEMRPDEEFSFVILMLPVLISMILFEVVNMVACQCIISDDPLKRMLLSPAKKSEVVIAKFSAYSFLGALVTFICLFILWFFFKVPFANFIDTFVVSLFAAIFGVSFGVLFSSFSTSRLQAAQLSIFIFVLQFMLVLFIRVEPFVNIMPMEIVRAIFVAVAFRDIPLRKIPWALPKLIGINMLALLLAIFAYKRKKEAV